jgi:hypothetical protein
MRIDGVGSEYSDLLEAAGVDSPAELAQRNAANLAQTFLELDAARPDWIRSVPSTATVEGWIAQAKALPKIVTHGGGGGSGETGSTAGGETPAAAMPLMDAPAMDVASAPMSEAASGGPAMGEPAAAPAQPVAFTAPPEPSVPAAPSGSAARSDDGIWARIKRFFGG